MISLPPNLLEIAIAEPLTDGLADPAAVTDPGLVGAETMPFASLMSGLLGGENTPFSQPDEPSAPPAQPAQTMTEQSEKAFALPLPISVLEPVTPAGMRDIEATASTAQTPQRAEQTAASIPINTAVSGKSLPPSGNALPPVPPAAEQMIRNNTVSAEASAHIATGANTSLETEPERSSRLHQSQDKAFDFRIARDAAVEQIDAPRLQSESMPRDRTVQQPLATHVATFAANPANSIDTVSSSTLNFSTQPLSANPTASPVAVTPILDANTEPQSATEARAALPRMEPVVREQLATPYGNLRWHADFAGKLRVLSQANVSTVELNLNPAELGVIDIKIHSLDDGTVINFFSANPATREVIDSSLPRLRELLADSGIQLHHGDVSERSAQPDQSAAESKRALAIDLPEELGELQVGPYGRRESVSMIDHYV